MRCTSAGRVRRRPSASPAASASAASTQRSTAAIAALVSRSSASSARTSASSVSALGRGGQRGGRAPAPQPRLGGRQPAAGPLAVGAVVAVEQGQPDRHRVDAGGAQLGHQHEVAARLAHLLAVQPDHPGVDVVARRTAPVPVSTSAWAAECSWCGKIRSEPPPWTSKPMPEPVERDHAALDVPARPPGAERRVPVRLARARGPATAASRAGRACRPARGRRRARRTGSAWSSRS